MEGDLRDENERVDYWDRFYRGRGKPSIPSQFAVFVCDYLQPGQNVIEFGCGDGRDSFFLAAEGYRILGLDASGQAISTCRERLAQQKELAADFLRLCVSADWTAEQIDGAARDLKQRFDPRKPTAIYARFFLHAISEQEEIAFLKLVRALLSDGLCAVEFRTHRDFYLKKETSPHYRRYIDPLDFHARAHASGLEPMYFIEGFGYAKYKGDDAHVARFVLKEKPE